ncbi:MAG: hypothetical protein DI628_08620 [Blastochloris viridis]|uniref:TrbC/VIRB2 family protein n=1 Tax=Blastochloris viridis TaxID=1079 RepID=A0A6N4RA63_BLAVI|nr:MAG: hypothetical protein DI628_08620 [Blastochloris viridis]
MTKLLLLVVAALLLGAATGYAQSDAGAVELDLVRRIFTGNIGLFIGLAITIMGIIMFVQGDTGGAIFTVILGVLITMLPGVYNGLRYIACPIAEGFGGHCGTETSQ